MVDGYKNKYWKKKLEWMVKRRNQIKKNEDFKDIKYI